MSVSWPIIGLDGRRIDGYSSGKTRFGPMIRVNHNKTNGYEFCRKKKKAMCKSQTASGGQKGCRSLIDRLPCSLKIAFGAGGHLLGKEAGKKKTRQG